MAIKSKRLSSRRHRLGDFEHGKLCEPDMHWRFSSSVGAGFQRPRTKDDAEGEKDSPTCENFFAPGASLKTDKLTAPSSAKFGKKRASPKVALTPKGVQVRGFMLIEWLGEEVGSIRDSRYASYAVDGADIREI